MDIYIKNQIINILRGNDIDSINLAIGIIEANKNQLTQDDLTIFAISYDSVLHYEDVKWKMYFKMNTLCNTSSISYKTGWNAKFNNYPFNYDSLKEVLNDPNLKIQYTKY